MPVLEPGVGAEGEDGGGTTGSSCSGTWVGGGSTGVRGSTGSTIAVITANLSVANFSERGNRGIGGGVEGEERHRLQHQPTRVGAYVRAAYQQAQNLHAPCASVLVLLYQ